MQNVYIKAVAKFLPNEGVPNDQMESKLGFVNGNPSRAKSIVLRNNKILNRYYAIDENGNPTHTNAEMTAEAIQNVLSISAIPKAEVDIIPCGTSAADQMIPSHATVVHGCWQSKSIQLNSSIGICTSGMNALKYGFMPFATNNANL